MLCMQRKGETVKLHRFLLEVFFLVVITDLLGGKGPSMGLGQPERALPHASSPVHLHSALPVSCLHKVLLSLLEGPLSLQQLGHFHMALCQLPLHHTKPDAEEEERSEAETVLVHMSTNQCFIQSHM